MKPLFLILLVLLLLTGPSFAEVYRWVDERENVHFSDDIMQVPEKYRKTIERIGVKEGEEETKTESEPLAKKKEDIYQDRLGRGEEYWRARVEEWEKKMKTLKEKVETLRIRYNELTEKHNNSRSAAVRTSIRKEREQVKTEMDQYKIQIEEAKEMLEKKIPEEAELYKAKAEWIKQ
jgi:ribosomal protein S20